MRNIFESNREKIIRNHVIITTCITIDKIHANSIESRIFDTQIISGLLQIPKAMIQNKHEEGSQEPCSKNINQAHPGDIFARVLLGVTFIVFSSFLLIPLLRTSSGKIVNSKNKYILTTISVSSTLNRLALSSKVTISRMKEVSIKITSLAFLKKKKDILMALTALKK